ncbi:LytR/AlgR family response regulator transcription factor [Desulfitobacterium hafniense]|uniref:LytR/AlgR family response regulator transcription factor n=1 Tax=Desulfitobacterium hafniense TaxID=49338 RepID=UPI00037C5D1B|nr:LytTR family DNA-binding domain-containing protein [Desulfitobacterium hafniense]
MILVAVVEDEVQEQQKLRSFLADYAAQTGEKFTVSLFSRGADFLDCPESFDLALVDIMLGQENINGIEVAHQWRAKNPDALLIFVTNMLQYALQSYAVDALNYIVKPVEYSLFAQKLGRAVELLHLRRKKKICFTTQSGMECLDGEEIYYIETFGRGLKIHTVNRSIYCTETLKTMEELLQQECFFRCHKAILVNLLHVSSIHKASVTIGGEEVPVSRHRKKEFMDALVNCFGGSVS